MTSTHHPATCIGCGCTDHHACPGGCTWLRVDYDLRAGVCSRCQTYLAAWDAGRRVRCFQPTNETVGESVLADWCGTCELGKDGPCIIAANTMLYRDTDPEYPQEWRYDTAGYPGCVAYVQLGLPVMPTRCDRTEDMFEHSEPMTVGLDCCPHQVPYGSDCDACEEDEVGRP